MFERTFKVSSESRLAVGACDWLYRIDDDVRALRGAYIGLAHVHTGCVENASHSHIGHIHKMQEEREQFQVSWTRCGHPGVVTHAIVGLGHKKQNINLVLIYSGALG